MPAVHYLAHYKDDLETPEQLNTFMHLLLCVQDLALSFNRLFGACKDLHPFAVDRFFVVRSFRFRKNRSIGCLSFST